MLEVFIGVFVLSFLIYVAYFVYHGCLKDFCAGGQNRERLTEDVAVRNLVARMPRGVLSSRYFSPAQWQFRNSDMSIDSAKTDSLDRSLSISIYQPPTRDSGTLPRVTLTPAE